MSAYREPQSQAAPLSEARQRPASWWRKARRGWRRVGRDDRQVLVGVFAAGVLAALLAVAIPWALVVAGTCFTAVGIKAAELIRFALETLRREWSVSWHVRRDNRWFRAYSRRMAKAGLD